MPSAIAGEWKSAHLSACRELSGNLQALIAGCRLADSLVNRSQCVKMIRYLLMGFTGLSYHLPSILSLSRSHCRSSLRSCRSRLLFCSNSLPFSNHRTLHCVCTKKRKHLLPCNTRSPCRLAHRLGPVQEWMIQVRKSSRKPGVESLCLHEMSSLSHSTISSHVRAADPCQTGEMP